MIDFARSWIEVISVFIAFSGLMLGIMGVLRKSQDRKMAAIKAAIDDGLAGITKELAHESDDRRAEIERERKARADAMSAVNGRIDRVEDTQGEIAEIKGELRAMRTTLDKIQEWFINGGPGK